MTFDNRQTAAFGAASDAVKQVLALATASIGGAIALFDNGDKAGIDFGAGDCGIRLGLLLLAFSVLAGLLALGAIAGQLGSSRVDTPSTYARGIGVGYGLQLAFYGAGILALVLSVIL